VDYASESWPIYHFHALEEEGRCRPYDPNGCIFWKGRYHLMYIYQDSKRGHSWGHASSTDLTRWTIHPPAIVPRPEDASVGTFSGNALISKEGVPMLCWYGISAGVCIATAEDDELLRWKPHPANPILPQPRKGEPGHGVYRVWDPFLWLEGDTYYCALGGNVHEDGEDTLYLCRSKDLETWEPLHPFYRAEPSWTVEGEDISCPDFFELGGLHVLLGISHSVGARCYIGKYVGEQFFPEKHVRLNWPGANFFAPESLLDDQGRRIVWAWVTDPRLRSTQLATGSGVMSLPRLLSLGKDRELRIEPVPELESLRSNLRVVEDLALDSDVNVIPSISGAHLELAAELELGTASQVGLLVRCAPDGSEATGIWYDAEAEELRVDLSRSTLRRDVAYLPGAVQTFKNESEREQALERVAAPFLLGDGERLKLRVFLDGPVLEVFANGRQSITQQIFPSRQDSLGLRVGSRGGAATLRTLRAWDMAPTPVVNEKHGVPQEERVLFEDSFRAGIGKGWAWRLEQAAHWCLRGGGLEVHSLPRESGVAPNTLVRSAPDRAARNYAVDVRVSMLEGSAESTAAGGMTLLRDGKPLLRVVLTRVDGRWVVLPGSFPLAVETVQLRLIVGAGHYTVQLRPEGVGRFETAATGPLPSAGTEESPAGTEELALECSGGSSEREPWFRFQGLRVFLLP